MQAGRDFMPMFSFATSTFFMTSIVVGSTELHQQIFFFKLIGYCSVIGHLRGKGLRVKRDDVRQSMWRVDPSGRSTMAVRGAIRRRTYSVEGPLALWHIDGHHKLIRFVIDLHLG